MGDSILRVQSLIRSVNWVLAVVKYVNKEDKGRVIPYVVELQPRCISCDGPEYKEPPLITVWSDSPDVLVAEWERDEVGPLKGAAREEAEAAARARDDAIPLTSLPSFMKSLNSSS